MSDPKDVAAPPSTFYIPGPPRPAVVYPDTDGQPIAENTLQFEYITTIKWGVEATFRDDPQVFVAGDLFWYPVEGDATIVTAPDTMAVFGRPRGYRSSYMQWEEGGIAPQVVFEVWSPGNRARDFVNKFEFYQRYRVEEYYGYDPDRGTLDGWLRKGERLESIPQMQGWISPRLRVRFELAGTALKLYGPDGRPFLTYLELVQSVRQGEVRAEQEKQRAEQEKQRAERLAAQLRAAGIDPVA